MASRGGTKSGPGGNSTTDTGAAGIETREDLVAALDQLRRHGPDGTARQRVTLQNLASSTEIPVSTIHSYLSGRTLPPPEALDAIVWVLGVRGRERGAWADALDRVHAAGKRTPSTPAPRTMAPPLRDFVGRADVLAEMTQQWQRSSGRAPLILLTGAGGIGKTSLALEWAHRHASDFPDGALQVDLGGFGQGEPLGVARAQRLLLAGLGVSSDRLPTDPDELRALYHSTLSGKRLVILLDNVRDGYQVRDLLTSAPHLTTIMTSRDTLRSLAVEQGVTPIRVPLMDAQEAAVLLTRASGGAADPQRLEAVTAACSGLPLALRLSADALNVLPGVDPRDPLTLMVGGVDRGVRGAIDSTLAVLSDEGRILFRRLGAIPGTWIGFTTASVVVGDDLDIAFDELVSLNLLEPRLGGWTRHDLVTDAAAPLADADPGTPALRDRLAAHYAYALYSRLGAVGTFVDVQRIPRPEGLPELSDEIRDQLLEEELPAITGLCRILLAHGQHTQTSVLLDVLSADASQHGGFEEFDPIARELATDTAADPASRWYACLALARSAFHRGDARGELQWYQTGYAIVEDRPEDDTARLAAMVGLGSSLLENSDFQGAVNMLQAASDIGRRSGELRYVSYAQNCLGGVQTFRGNQKESLEAFAAAADAAEAQGLSRIATLPRLNAARAALDLFGADHDPQWLRRAEENLDAAERNIGERDVNLRIAATLVRARVVLADGDPDRALEIGTSAGELADEAGEVWNRQQIQQLLAEASHGCRRFKKAEQHARLAIVLAKELHDPRAQLAGEVWLGRILLDSDDLPGATQQLVTARALLAAEPTADNRGILPRLQEAIRTIAPGVVEALDADH